MNRIIKKQTTTKHQKKWTTTMHELTEDEKTAIRDVYKNGAGEFSIRQIALHFDIRKSVVYQVLRDGKSKKSTSEPGDVCSELGIDSDADDDNEAVDQTNAGIQWTEAWWATTTPEVQAHRCKAHRKNGNRCRRAAINGATVCRTHGGAAKHVRNAAKARLQNAADLMARELLKMATNDNVSDAVKLAAIKDALDRGGLGAKTEVEIMAKPYEAILDMMEGVQGGSREDFRRGIGSADAQPPALATANPHAPIDAEIIENAEPTEDDEFDWSPGANPHDQDQCHGDDGYRAYPTHQGTAERGAREHLADDDGYTHTPDNPFGADASATAVLMPLDEAVTVAAEIRRSAARLRPIQRALPPGRSR